MCSLRGNKGERRSERVHQRRGDLMPINQASITPGCFRREMCNTNMFGTVCLDLGFIKRNFQMGRRRY
jgi:hypothetical protein